MSPLRLIQLTDLHLFGDPAGRLLGLTTRLSFETVLARALSDGEGVGCAAPALVLTGDLVHDESAEGYAYLSRVLDATGLQCFCIAGNHDRIDLMAAHLRPGLTSAVAGRRLGGWHLAFLDTTVGGKDGGQLDEAVLEAAEILIATERAPTLIFLHHHPIPIGSVWMDTMGVDNGAALVELCRRYAHVKGLLFGHIHQELATARGDLQILGTPSTCVQFLPGSEQFALDSRPPGYREIRLYPDGRLETWVERIDDYPEPLDWLALGY